MKNGRVIINRNICDNAPECSGIEVCPVGALFWDEINEQIQYNSEICCDCGMCADACPVGAILWGKDDEDYRIKLETVENDDRKLEELVVERYGAAPIDKEPIDFCDIQDYLSNSTGELVFVEIFSDDSINCLLHSIRVEEILSWFESRIQYQKACVSENDNLDGYGISELPSLLIYKNKQLIGIIEGNYNNDSDSKALLRRKLFEIIKC